MKSPLLFQYIHLLNVIFYFVHGNILAYKKLATKIFIWLYYFVELLLLFKLHKCASQLSHIIYTIPTPTTILFPAPHILFPLHTIPTTSAFQ